MAPVHHSTRAVPWRREILHRGLYWPAHWRTIAVGLVTAGVLGAGVGCVYTGDMAAAATTVGSAAAGVLIAHGRCTSLAECANGRCKVMPSCEDVRELLVVSAGSHATTVDVFDIDDPALALEIAVACGRLRGTRENFGRIVVRVYRVAPRRPARHDDGSRTGYGIPGWRFTFETI